MRRREFISLLGGVAAWPRAVRAQQPVRMRRVGFLMVIAEADPEARPRVIAFLAGLQDLGWIDGRNVRIDYRWAAGSTDTIRAFAVELTGLTPDLIVVTSTPALAALRTQTRSIPIVFVGVSDPIGDGFVMTFARPGGNITGFTNVESSLAGKWLELLKETVPALARAALMFNPETASGGGSYFLRPFDTLATSFRLAPISAPVHNVTEIERVITELAEPGGGLVVMPDAFTTAHRELIAKLAAQHRVPTIYPYRFFVASGGLISYGPDMVDLYRRAAAYVDRILKGENPAELPVQAPTKFELVINVKTAKALGLTIPPMLLARADEIIE